MLETFVDIEKNVHVKYILYIHVYTNMMTTLRHDFVTEQRVVVVTTYIFIMDEISSFFSVVSVFLLFYAEGGFKSSSST